MSKAYLLVICLLAASFTGCLADDTSDSIEQDENTEKETIEPVGQGNNHTSDNTNSNITMRYGYNSSANFSKMGNIVHINFSAYERFYDFIWFYDYAGNEIRRNSLYNGFDNCYSNGNWSAWDTNGSEDCIEQYELQYSNGELVDSGSVIWEFNLAREPMSVAIGQGHYYVLESF
jgi:hypothetical protein